MKQIWAVVLCLCMGQGAVAQVSGQEPRQDAAQEGVTIDTRVYHCEAGAQVQATYVNGITPAVAVIVIHGQQIALRTVPSGSGAFYAQHVVAGDPSGYLWITKGDEAALEWRGKADQRPLLLGCMS
ncbi:hypothetical protein BFP70_03025 [Thioclava sp. SK-1]|uniref:MliC family protein n=1 Tax=Thioclava sp. SK-1 TaxID=1889770 RepID=UPI000825F1A1|nr:MliC family protein [Thioclava sp. SK-1]OCX67148.1 hypothetical protein BFP70_03025 [Thioclava sp. SK-1]